MAYYLVSAQAKEEKLDDLRDHLRQRAYMDLRPFGRSLTKGLEGARVAEDGRVLWEEEDYCSPPLAMERNAVLDDYFDDIQVKSMEQGAGWQQIEGLPRLFPELERASTQRTVSR